MKLGEFIKQLQDVAVMEGDDIQVYIDCQDDLFTLTIPTINVCDVDKSGMTTIKEWEYVERHKRYRVPVLERRIELR